MASEFEIRQVAIKVKNVYNEINRRREKVYSEVKDTAFWWGGSAGHVFVDEYRRINDDIYMLLDILAGLELYLIAMANAAAELEAKIK